MALTPFHEHAWLSPVNRAFFAARQAVLLLHDVASANGIGNNAIDDLEQWVTDEALLLPEIGEVLFTMITIGNTRDAVRRQGRIDQTASANLSDAATLCHWAMAKCAALIVALGPAEPVTDETARQILEAVRARAAHPAVAAPATGAAS